MSRLALKQGHFSTILMSTQGCSTRSGLARLAWPDEKLGQSRGSELASNTNLIPCAAHICRVNDFGGSVPLGSAIRFWLIAFLRRPDRLVEKQF